MRLPAAVNLAFTLGVVTSAMAAWSPWPLPLLVGWWGAEAWKLWREQ